jgi:hypothetical protein
MKNTLVQIQVFFSCKKENENWYLYRDTELGSGSRIGIWDLFTFENLSGTFYITSALLSPHSAALVQTVPALVL